jgi:hypothetical protein
MSVGWSSNVRGAKGFKTYLLAVHGTADGVEPSVHGARIGGGLSGGQVMMNDEGVKGGVEGKRRVRTGKRREGEGRERKGQERTGKEGMNGSQSEVKWLGQLGQAS